MYDVSISVSLGISVLRESNITWMVFNPTVGSRLMRVALVAVVSIIILWRGYCPYSTLTISRYFPWLQVLVSSVYNYAKSS